MESAEERLQEIARLQKQVAEERHRASVNQTASDICREMIEQGIARMDDEGNFVLNERAN